MRLDSASRGEQEDDDEGNDGTVESYHSKTQTALDNSLIIEIYGSINLFTWLKYWYIDGMLKQQIMLTDKTRVIYHKKKDGTDGDKPVVKPKPNPELDQEIEAANAEALRVAKAKLKAQKQSNYET